MGLGLGLKLCLLFFCGCVALSQGAKVPAVCVRIGSCSILEAAKHSMTDSRILDELAEAATKNKGSNKAIKGIKGLKVKDIRPPKIYVAFVKDTGMTMTVQSQITIAGKSFIGGTMEITVASNMSTNSRITMDKSSQIAFQVTKCNVELLSCKTNLPSSMLPKIVNKFLNSTLGKVLPGMMCPAADKVVDAMKKKAESMYVQTGIDSGNRGTCQYSIREAPVITSEYLQICLKIQLTRKDRTPVEISTEPPISEDMPALGHDNSDIIMPASIMNAFMDMYKSDLDQDVSSDMVGGVITIAVLREKLPSVTFPPTDRELMMKIRSASTPTWSLEPGEANLMVSLTIDLVAAEQQFFCIRTTLKISATFQMGETSLDIILGDGSLENTALESSTIGVFDVELLNSYLLDILTATTVATLRTLLHGQLPFPSLMGASIRNAVIVIEKNALRISVISDCDFNTVVVENVLN